MIRLYLFIRCVMAVLPFGILCLALLKNNLPVEKRYCQLLMPVAALLYCVGSTLMMEKLVVVALWFLELLNRFISLNILKVENWRINWGYWVLLLTNLVILVLYFPVKRLLLILMNHLWSNEDRAAHYWQPGFYEFNEEKKQWVLKEKWGHLKHFYKYIFIGAIVVSCALLAASYLLTDLEVFKYRYYAVFGLLVLSELVAYLSGPTIEEYKTQVLGLQPEEEEALDFAKLRETYREIYGERILADTFSERGMNSEDAKEVLRRARESRNHSEAAFAVYLEREWSRNHSISCDYIASVGDMLSGKSVLYANPFYRDLTPCIFFSMNMVLLKQGKALIIPGHHGAEEEMLEWTEEGMESICHVPGFWRTEVLQEVPAECDIGILPFHELFNLKLLNENREFLQDVSFVVLLEPSCIVTHSQIALSMIVSQIECVGKKIVYCACDRNLNGLVDTLSHVLRTEFVEVKATVTSARQSTCIYWNPDGEAMHHKLMKEVVRYLGGGTSLAMVALNHGIKQVCWYSSQRFPVCDIRWLVGQYYEKICQYIKRPVSQEALEEAFHVSGNLWSVSREKRPCLIVEDEYYNLFEMGRQFVTRGEQMSFVNVISSNYMLRDYMSDNYRIFMGDPKAIAQVVPDFSRTKRNIVLQIVMRMAEEEMSSREIEKELTIAGIAGSVSRESLESLISEYFDLSDYGIIVKETRTCDELDWENETLCTSHYYCLSNKEFIQNCVSMLKSAYYVGEDDLTGQHFLGGRLLGHVYQTFVPGQMFSFAGKYYQIVSINHMENSYKNAVLVRRAADHVDDRVYYRQLRTYSFEGEGFQMSEHAGDCRTLNQIRIYIGAIDVAIRTDGYLEMKSYNDLKHAVRVEVDKIPVRRYRKKEALRLEMPGAEPSVRIGLAIMLNEIFRTVYPDSSDYITVLAGGVSDIQMPDGLLFRLEGKYDPDCLYVVEDSQIDLGLISSVERNLKQYLEIAMDYIQWTQKLMQTGAVPQPEGEAISEADLDGIRDGKKHKKTWWQRIKDFLRRLLCWKKKEEPEKHTIDTEEASCDPENTGEQSNNNVVDNGTEIDGDDEIVVQPSAASDFVKRHYLKYGDEEFLPVFDLNAIEQYLSLVGVGDNLLGQTRKRQLSASDLEKHYNPYDYSKHFCDFCGRDMTGMQYDQLADGRERCPQCGATAVRTVDDFREIYRSVLRQMEAFYNISLNVPVEVKMTDARKLARRMKSRYVATPGFDGRAVGVAFKSGGKYSLLVENGAPYLSAVSTIAHELTHIWQFSHWNLQAVQKRYGKDIYLEIMEGMAKWSEIQFLMLLDQKEYAKREEIMTRMRNDEYGRGFLLYIKKYPFCQGRKITGDTPFMYINDPL